MLVCDVYAVGDDVDVVVVVVVMIVVVEVTGTIALQPRATQHHPPLE